MIHKLFLLVHLPFITAFLILPSELFAQQIPEDDKWSRQFGGPVGFNDSVSKVIPVGDSLIAIGSFLRVSDEITEEIALWDGQWWHAMTGGVCDYMGLGRGIPRCDFYTAYMKDNIIFALARVHLPEDEYGRLSLLKWEDNEWVKEYQWADNRNNIAYDALVDGESVYIAGGFTTVLEDSTLRGTIGVIRWDGQDWETIGGINTDTFPFGLRAERMVKTGDYLYLKGEFKSINGVAAQNVARWDGTEWSSMGDVQFNSTTDIFDIAADKNGNVYVVGEFLNLFDGAIAAYNLAKWDGTEWSTVQDPAVRGFESYRVETIGDSVFVWGGIQNQNLGIIGGSGNWGMVFFDGQNWHPVRERLDQDISSLAVFKEELVIVYKNTVQRLTDEGFRSIDNPNAGVNDTIRDLEVDEAGNLYAVGSFNEAGGQPSTGIARWNGMGWDTYGSIFNGELRHVTTSGNAVYVAPESNYFPFATEVNGAPLESVAIYENGQWGALPGFGGESPFSFITDLESDGTNLYVSGQLLVASGTSNILQWDGRTWIELEGDAPFSSFIHDIEVAGADIYVAGNFEKGPDAPANKIARWDGSTWHPIGNDDFPGSRAEELEIQNGVLYANGYRWINGDWEEYGITGLDVKVDGTTMYAGTGHRLADPVVVNESCTIESSDIKVLIDGQEGTLGSGTRVCNPPYVLWQHFPMNVYAVEVVEDGVYFAGSFSHLGGIPSNNIGFWSVDSASNVSTEDAHPHDNALALSSPFPNPFRHRVNTTYTLPSAQHIKIEIHNVLGQRIATLVDGIQAAGPHDVQWKAGTAPAGLYFLILSTNDQRQVQKMVLTR